MAGKEGKGRGAAKTSPGPEKPLTQAQAEFCLLYLGNGGNAGSAYQRSHPGARTAGSAWTQGSRLLRNVKVAKVLTSLREERFKRLTMSADEAAMLVSISARADLRLAYDAEGTPIPFHQWPDELAKAVKSMKPDGTVVLHDGLKARETILQMSGKLKTTVDVNHFDHLGYLAGKTAEQRGDKGEG